MKLAEDEKIVAEYYFDNLTSKEYNDASNKSILTNKRLIVIYQNAEENYPLSKITGVKVKQHSNPILLIIGVVLAVLMICGLAFGGSKIGVTELLLAIALPAILIILGLRHKTSIVITQMGGEKRYLVKRKKNDTLNDFIDSVNHTLT